MSSRIEARPALLSESPWVVPRSEEEGMKCSKCGGVAFSLAAKAMTSPTTVGGEEQVMVLRCSSLACQAAAGMWIKDVRRTEILESVRQISADLKTTGEKLDRLMRALQQKGVI